MGNKYDAILKEKKVYKEQPVSSKHKYFKLSIFFAFLVSILIIAITYIIYFNTVLDNESIFLNDIEMIKEDYDRIYTDIKFPYNFKDNHVVVGSIDIGNDNYKYTFQRDANRVLRSFYNGNNRITYYEEGKDSYIKLSGLGDFYIKENRKLNSIADYESIVNKAKNDFNGNLYSSFLNKNASQLFNQIYNISNFDNTLDTIRNNFQTSIASNRYVRKLYFDSGRPIVEVSLDLEKSDVSGILNVGTDLEVKDDYNVIVTMRNDAINNTIKNIKMVINNKSKNTREVLEYKSHILFYTNGNSDKYSIKYDVGKSSIQIKKNDVLYGFVQITSKNNTSIYTYKVIDKIYTVSLAVEKVKNNFSYTVETNIDNVPKAVKISGEIGKSQSINENVLKSFNLDSLSMEQQKYYKKTVEELLK